jgi:hypothetical protein
MLIKVGPHVAVRVKTQKWRTGNEKNHFLSLHHRGGKSDRLRSNKIADSQTETEPAGSTFRACSDAGSV